MVAVMPRVRYVHAHSGGDSFILTVFDGTIGWGLVHMKFPFQGQFWLPGFSDKPTFGTLTFSRREGANLALTDTLPGSTNSYEFEVFQGQTASGQYVTLLHAIRTAEPSLPITPLLPCTYHATFLLVGVAFDSEAEMCFSFWQIHIPELKAWAGKTGFLKSSPTILGDAEHQRIHVSYETPERQTLLDGECGTTLSLAYWPLSRVTPFSRTIRQEVYFELQLAGNNALSEFMNLTTGLEQFLTLATGALVRAGSIQVTFNDAQADSGTTPQIVEILYQPIRNASPPAPRPDEFLFSLRDIEGMERECFRNWFTKAEWLAPVCAIYFGILYNPSKYLDFNFLALIQALEAYHRRATDETDLPASEHEARMKAILGTAPDPHRQWLSEKLQYSNELSLRRRLKRLSAKFSFLLDELVSDRKATINSINDNRNYLTHYDKKLALHTARGGRLLYLVEVLKLLLQACLLWELGFTEVKIKEFLSRSRTVRMIRHLSDHAAVTTV